MTTVMDLSNALAGAVERAAASVFAVRGRPRLPSTGVHWRAGLIITANHTVETDREVALTGPDGRTLSARVALGARDPHQRRPPPGRLCDGGRDMSRDTRTGTVIVVAHGSMYAARVEASLYELAGWRIAVSTPRQLRGLLEEHPAAIVALVLTDAETLRMLRATRAWPRGPAIIALSDDPARFWTSASRTLGLRAALPLRATAEELAGAVRAVHAGLFVLHPEALVRSRAGDMAAATGTPLSSREREILEMMADGATNRVIASRLGISRHTVKFHVAAILAKLGAGSRTQAVALALRGGLFAV